MECGELPEGPYFHTSLLDVFSTTKLFSHFCLAILAPWYYLGQVKAKLSNTNSVVAMVLGAVVFYGAIILAACEAALPNLGYVGLSVYFCFVGYGTGMRIEMRQLYGINGNIVEDLFTFLFLYPCASVQLHQQLVNTPLSNQNVGLVSIATIEGGSQSSDGNMQKSGNGEVNLAFDEPDREQVY